MYLKRMLCHWCSDLNANYKRKLKKKKKIGKAPPHYIKLSYETIFEIKLYMQVKISEFFELPYYRLLVNMGETLIFWQSFFF